MRKKVLIVCGQEIVKERNDGGKKCSFRNYELFLDVFGRENVYLCMFTNYTGNSDYVFRLRAYDNFVDRTINILGGHLFTSASNEKKVIEFIKNNHIDVVLFERSLYGAIIKKIKQELLPCEIWIFVHNLEKEYFRNKVKHQGIRFFLPYLKVIKSEKESFKYADYVITLTERDSRLIENYYSRKSDFILPMTFSDQFDEQRVSSIAIGDTKELLFIGTMFPPNYEGIKWFVENVMSELEDYHLSIVGKNFETKRAELERNNVSVIGTVDSPEEYYYADNIMVMPIFFGDGMKIKTAEAMMYGKTIIASNEALEGYDISDVAGIIRCNTKEEYVKAINNEFLTKEYVYRESVRTCFLNNYSIDKQKELCKQEWL